MNEDNKYYTPEISDLFVGYEYEYSLQSEYIEGGMNWTAYTIEEKDIHPDLKGWDSDSHLSFIFRNLKDEKIRTAYLTKEGIIQEGWFATKNVIRWDPFTLGDVELVLDDRNHNIHITIKGNPDDTLYSGECKSINEFRKIMKWLKIENPAIKS